MVATQQQRKTETQTQDVLDAAIQQTADQYGGRTDLLQMKMENESFMAECRARPRDLQTIRNELEQNLKMFPGLAEASIYSKPVGRDSNNRQKYVRGLSIRAAEILAECYGYNRVRCDATPLDADTVKVEATFVDFQRVRTWQDGGIVSKYYRSSAGKMVRYSDDRFYNVTVKAELAKRVREVILRSVNGALKQWFQDQCEKTLAQMLDTGKVNEIVKQFAGIGVSLEQLEQAVGKPRKLGWTEQDRVTLIGIWRAIQDGETSREEAFDADSPDSPPDRKPEMTADSLTKGEVEPPRNTREPGDEPEGEGKQKSFA